jgi:hypothetical protein
MRFFVSLFAALAVSFVAACTSSSATSTVAPTTAATTTDTFSGSFAQLGSASFPFTVAATGPVQISLTSVAPLATMALGVQVGTWDGTTCTPGIANNAEATTATTALSGTASAGTYCVQVSDSGNVPAATTVTFTVTVTHS